MESAFEFASICRKHDYHNLIFSMKASNPLVMVQVSASSNSIEWVRAGAAAAGSGLANNSVNRRIASSLQPRMPELRSRTWAASMSAISATAISSRHLPSQRSASIRPSMVQSAASQPVLM